MSDYDIYPAVNDENQFPPVIRQALATAQELIDAFAWAPQRNVPSTADLNMFDIRGIHRITTPDTATIQNLPVGMNQAGIFENLQTGSGASDWWVQRITTHGTSPRAWWRSTKDLIGGWNPWVEISDWAPMRSVPSTADMNTYVTPGLSRIRTPDTATITNLPPGMRSSGMLQNLVTGDGTDSIIAQQITENGDGGRLWWRSTNDAGVLTGNWSRADENNGPVTEWHVFPALGQSNMSGRGIVGTVAGGRYLSSRIAQFGYTRRVLETATVPLDMHDTATGLSPATVAAVAYLKTQPSHVGVLIVPASHGGTGFTTSTTTQSWTPGITTNPLYDLPGQAVKQTQDAIAAAKATGASVLLKAIWWLQGEDNGAMSTAVYASNLDALISYLRTQLNAPTLPFILGQMVPEGIIANSPGRANVDLAHQQTPSRVPYTAFAPATTNGYNPGDTTHMSKLGVDFVGNGMVNALKDAALNVARVNELVAPAMAAYLAANPSVITAAAAAAQGNAGLLPKWKPNTAYTTGDQVVNPDGDTVTRTTPGTSGASYTATNWTSSPTVAAVTAATSANTPGAIVKRDSNGDIFNRRVLLTDAPTGTNHATRKDYVDASAFKVVTGVVASTPPSAFPQGTSFATVSDASWPASLGSVITFRYGGGRTSQRYAGKLGRIFERTETDGDIWTPFVEHGSRTGTTPVGQGELFKNLRDYRLTSDSTDSGAIGRAHAANPVVLYADGKSHDSGFYLNLYGGYQNALGPRLMAGKTGSPVTDAEPVMWVQKYSNANRSVNAAEWDNGAIYAAVIKEGGDAYVAGMTGYVRHASSAGGQSIGVHGRAYASLAESQVWGGWSYAWSAAGYVPHTVIGHEINIVNKGVDGGWKLNAGVGSHRGLVVVSADGSNPITHGVYIGANSAAPNGFMHTGLQIEGAGIMPSDAAMSSSSVANNEYIRLDGNAVAASASTGIRLRGGRFRVGLSLAEATYDSNVAIHMGDGHRIAVGAGPGVSRYVEFNSTTAQFNLSNLAIAFAGLQVVSARKTGWGAPTGTATRTAFATSTVTLPQLAEVVKALVDDFRSHGLIGT